MTGSSHGVMKVMVLYKVSNYESDSSSYNAFEMPRGRGVTLASVKQHCLALRGISNVGADGYHWRVRVDDKGSTSKSPKYSWWDIQDENARLPVKDATFTEINHMISPPKVTSSSVEDASVAKGAMRSLGKAMNKVAASVEGSSSTVQDNGPRVPIITFKLLDLIKVHDSFSPRTQGRPPSNPHKPKPNGTAPSRPISHATPVARTTATTKPTCPPAQGQRQSAPPVLRPPVSAQSSARRSTSQPQSEAPAPQISKPPMESLMDFGPAPTPSGPTLHHSTSLPASFGATLSNESRAQKLKREYEKKKQTQNRVWDEVDQRWITIDAKPGTLVKGGSTSAPPSALSVNKPQAKVKGISLDAANTVGKSAHVAAAVNARINDMKSSQQKAVNEIRERELKKKEGDAAEDLARQRLEPKIKAWSEEHGKKKQLRALLSSLHTILWTGAKWKPVNLGDILDDRKCKLSFHKASRVVHPDKTMDLDPEKKFLAKRIFDALSQAKADFDEGKK